MLRVPVLRVAVRLVQHLFNLRSCFCRRSFLLLSFKAGLNTLLFTELNCVDLWQKVFAYLFFDLIAFFDADDGYSFSL